MRTEQPTKCLFYISYGGEVAGVKLVLAPQSFITDRSNAVVLMWSLSPVLESEFR